MHEAIHALGFFAVDVLFDVKPLHFATELGVVMGYIDLSDGANAVGPTLDAFPELFVSNAQRRHGAQAGYNNSFVFHSLRVGSWGQGSGAEHFMRCSIPSDRK